MQNKIAEKELCLLVLLLCCLLLLQENNIIMMNQYRHFYVQKRLLLTQAVEKGHRECKIKREEIEYIGQDLERQTCGGETF